MSHLFEFAALQDEETSAIRAGVRFWQLADNKPLRATLYEEDGYTEYVCGNEGCEEVKREEPTAALGHSYGDWQLTREPVEGVNGQLTSKCTNEGCDSQQVRDTELQMLPMVEKTELCYSYTVELRAKNSAGKNVTVYTYQVDDEVFSVSSAQLKEILDGVPLSTPAVMEFIKGYIKENMDLLSGGAS